MIKQLILAIWLIIFSSIAWSSDELIAIDADWQFYQTDDISLDYSAIPAKDWQAVTPSQLLATNANNGIYGWYKVSFDWQHSVSDNWLLYFESIRYGDETWLNGQPIGATGKILTPWDFVTPNPQNVARKYQIPPNLLKPQDNILAVKVNLGIGQTWGAMFPGGVGIGGDTIAIGTPDVVHDVYNQQLIHNTRFDTILVTLGLIDLFIIIFLFRTSIHHFREFWWLLISSSTMMCGSLLLDYCFMLGERPNGLRLFSIFFMLIVPLTSALYFRAMYQNVSDRKVYILVTCWLLLVAFIVTPNVATIIKEMSWLLWTALVATVYLYCLISVINGIRQRSSGAVLQLIGLSIYIASIRTQWLPYDFYEHRNIIIGTLVFRYALLFSYFQRISQMSNNYKKLSQRLLITIENHKKDIARDLHDDLGQHLSAAKLQLLSYDQGETKLSMSFIKEEINAAILSTREIMEGLHPMLLEQYRFDEVVLQETRRLMRLYPVEIKLTMSKTGFDKAIEKQLFRIIQEALCNAIKHGKASLLHVQLAIYKHQIHLIITDNGVGFNPNKLPLSSTHQGFGLISLHERVALINGNLQLASIKGESTTIKIILPYKNKILTPKSL